MPTVPRFMIACAIASSLFLCGSLSAQTGSSTGAIEFTARITPTAAKAEPVRQFTFYLLSKSYTDISQEVENDNVVPPRETFIDGLKVSSQLKAWLKAHDVMDLTLPGVDHLMTADDIIHIPEFLMAYQRSNSGGVTTGIPKPKYKEADKTEHPDRYKKDNDDYLAALKKFIQTHPETVSGAELELDAVNPQRQWAKVQNDHRRKVLRLAPEFAQTKYLVAHADTDLDGRATITGVAPGNYWLSTLNLDASTGDTRVSWDVPVTVSAGQVTRINLTNLNASDARAATTP